MKKLTNYVPVTLTKALLKGIDFVQSICTIKDTENIPLFENDNNFVSVEFLWQRFLNYIVPKYLLKSISTKYAIHTSHDFFEMCIRTVGNLALKCIWKTFIQSKVEFLFFEKAKEETFAENL